MFKEYLAKYLEELKASGVKVNLVEKNSLTMFALWLNKNAAQQSVQADGATCPNCKFELLSEWYFCPRCGHKTPRR